jgi:Domain of unknown function (DUF4338)
MMVQGRTVLLEDLCLIRQWLEQNPSWNRTRLSRELCRHWDWRAVSGRYKDMACRSLLLKLEQRGLLTLPLRHSPSKNGFRHRSIPFVPHSTCPIDSPLKTLLPLQIEIVTASTQALFACLLARYHYLGYRGTVGQNMKYLVRACSGAPVACLLFGSAAWKTAPRDRFIGFNASSRERCLPYLSNNMRFLILPWVGVPSLASFILSRIAKRISSDWSTKYGHPLYLLETFVDRSRFLGTSYQAANWIYVGQSQGRTRNDSRKTIRVSLKDVYLYPLTSRWRELLSP